MSVKSKRDKREILPFWCRGWTVCIYRPGQLRRRYNRVSEASFKRAVAVREKMRRGQGSGEVVRL